MQQKLFTGVFKKKTLIAAIIRDLQAKGKEFANYDTALLISANVFHGEIDRNERPLAEHYLQVFLSDTHSDAKISVGVLHDLIEDSCWTLEDLRTVGFKEEVVKGVSYLTWQKEEELYFDYIERVGMSFNEFGSDHTAIDPKISDLKHNTDLFREKTFLTAEQQEKQKLYTVAKNYLVAIKSKNPKKKIEPGTPMSWFMDNRMVFEEPELLQKKQELLQKHSSGKRQTVLDKELSGAPQFVGAVP